MDTITDEEAAVHLLALWFSYGLVMCIADTWVAKNLTHEDWFDFVDTKLMKRTNVMMKKTVFLSGLPNGGVEEIRIKAPFTDAWYVLALKKLQDDGRIEVGDSNVFGQTRLKLKEGFEEGMGEV